MLSALSPSRNWGESGEEGPLKWYMRAARAKRDENSQISSRRSLFLQRTNTASSRMRARAEKRTKKLREKSKLSEQSKRSFPSWKLKLDSLEDVNDWFIQCKCSEVSDWMAWTVLVAQPIRHSRFRKGNCQYQLIDIDLLIRRKRWKSLIVHGREMKR